MKIGEQGSIWHPTAVFDLAKMVDRLICKVPQLSINKWQKYYFTFSLGYSMEDF